MSKPSNERRRDTHDFVEEIDYRWRAGFWPDEQVQPRVGLQVAERRVSGKLTWALRAEPGERRAGEARGTRDKCGEQWSRKNVDPQVLAAK